MPKVTNADHEKTWSPAPALPLHVQKKTSLVLSEPRHLVNIRYTTRNQETNHRRNGEETAENVQIRDKETYRLISLALNGNLLRKLCGAVGKARGVSTTNSSFQGVLPRKEQGSFTAMRHRPAAATSGAHLPLPSISVFIYAHHVNNIALLQKETYEVDVKPMQFITEAAVNAGKSLN